MMRKWSIGFVAAALTLMPAPIEAKETFNCQDAGNYIYQNKGYQLPAPVPDVVQRHIRQFTLRPPLDGKPVLTAEEFMRYMLPPTPGQDERRAMAHHFSPEGDATKRLKRVKLLGGFPAFYVEQKPEARKKGDKRETIVVLSSDLKWSLKLDFMAFESICRVAPCQSNTCIVKHCQSGTLHFVNSDYSTVVDFERADMDSLPRLSVLVEAGQPCQFIFEEHVAELEAPTSSQEISPSPDETEKK